MADGFTEEWYRDHQARMAGLRRGAVARVEPSATRESLAKAGDDAKQLGAAMIRAPERSAGDRSASKRPAGAACCVAEPVSRPAGGRSPAATSERMDVTGGERPAPKRKRRHPEQDLQKDVIKFLDAALLPFWRVIHVPNGGTTGGHKAKIVGGIRRAMGVRDGYPDLTLLGPNRFVVIELKAPGRNRKPSPAQEEWRDWFRHIGMPWFLCQSIEDVIAACQDAGVPLRVRQ